ncbi:MAG: IS110 family transposase [Cyclobacteriaceae bacterium]|nr:IS110 family transposase [Cyclobacteriaceae bacterium]MBX2897993.1 IS110 family transposase [Cyclobacteriaceae bacterium]
MNSVRNFIGVDVAKKTLDLCVLDAEGHTVSRNRIENKPKCISAYFEMLQKDLTLDMGTVLVCLEHTGVYSNFLLEYLSSVLASVCVEMALQIKRSQGIQRGKSDKIDALRIAEYAHLHHRKLRLWAPTRKQVQELKALVSLRDRLVRVANQLRVALKENEEFIDRKIHSVVNASCKASLIALEKDLKKVDEKINKLINKDEGLNKQMKLLTSVTGIGRAIATQMIITTNEFQLIREPKKFACYAGVAPFEHSSGTSIKSKPRVSKMANMEMKKLLYLGATSAIQYSPEMKAYYERKIAAGKKPMSVINAVRNKLISRAFVCINQNRSYEKNYKHTLA